MIARILLTAIACGSLGSAAVAEPVSYYREIRPILARNCTGCHKPGKTKGGLDLTTHAAVIKGGKSGHTLRTGHPAESELLLQVRGEEPEMPKEGEPLLPAEITLIERWITEGAKDDTPANPPPPHRLDQPPRYTALPSVAALAYSPDGTLLAVAGWHEVLLHYADGAGIAARLVGESPAITSVAFSPDGRFLAIAGGAPSEYGEIQLWEVAARRLVRSIKTSNDTVFGVAFSPDATKVAVGCADKLVRAFSVADGRQIMECDNHIDWVFGAAWTTDGARLASASRDRALKLIDVATGHLVDDINRPREPLVALARHPGENVVLTGGENGALWLHRMEPRGGRLAEGDDKENSAIKELERIPGPATALAWSPDGKRLAAGGPNGEVRIFSYPENKRITTLKTKLPPVFALAFSADARTLTVAGADGRLRHFDAEKGELQREADSVPLEPATAAQ